MSTPTDATTTRPDADGAIDDMTDPGDPAAGGATIPWDPPRRRRRWRWTVLVVAAVVVAAGGLWVAGRDGVDTTAQVSAQPAATAEVTRQSITDTRSFDGTLGHGDADPVTADAEGVLTDVVDQGAAIDRGDVLYEVDGQPVVALYGASPMYRDLAVGDTGADVTQLIDNLHALGYGTDCDATDELTLCVAAATADWMADAGLPGPGGATVTAADSGIITGVAPSATDVTRGTELYRVDDEPVVALFGSVPMYRDLAQGDSGVDVAQLIDNLHALGYGTDCDAVDEYTWCVRTAVEQWQADRGVDETGRVDLGDVAFVPSGTTVDTIHVSVGDQLSPGTPVVDVTGAPIDATGTVIEHDNVVFVGDNSRVDTAHSDVGDAISPGAPLFDVTGADQVASLEVEVRNRDLLAAGTEVTVQLPGGATVPGVVTSASVVAAADESAEDSITEVEVTLDEPVDESLLGAPVDVLVDVAERTDVLTVPVNALLALSGGGHGVEVVAADGTTSIVPVDTGLFAGGWVEVAGDGIDEGTTVAVAGR